MNKKTTIIIISAVLLLIGGGILFSKTRKSDKNPSAPKNVEKKVSELAVNYELSDKSSHLQIKQSKEVFVLNTAFSMPENVTIAFDYDSFDETNMPLGYMQVIPVQIAQDKVKSVRLDHKYDNYMQEYMAIQSSTQCAILLPKDFENKQVADFSIITGNRKDHCTFGLPKPEEQEMHMYAFEQGNYLILLSLNGEASKIPENPTQLMETVISLTIIK